MRPQRFAIISAVLLLVLTGGLGYFYIRPPRHTAAGSSVNDYASDLKAFSSVEEMKSYLKAGSEVQPTALQGLMKMGQTTKVVPPTMSTGSLDFLSPNYSVNDSGGSQKEAAPQAADRVSTTNVQVRGIDEPDTVKTDGTYIYLSQVTWSTYDGIRMMAPVPMSANGSGSGVASPAPATGIAVPEMIVPGKPSILPYPYPKPTPPSSQVVQALPISALALKAAIPDSGKMLLAGQTLVIESYQTITGYDVSNPASPTQKWKITLATGNQLLESRLYQGSLYLVQMAYPDTTTPCPMRPLSGSGVMSPEIPCGKIYHPAYTYANPAAYTISKVDMATGGVLASATTMGATSNSLVYMSEQALYIASYRTADQVAMSLSVLQSPGSPLSAAARSRLAKLETYELGQTAKYDEIQDIIQSQTVGMSGSQKLAFYESLQKATQQYVTDHKDELDATDIVKLNLGNMTVAATGKVPGTVLNSYSFDEYQGNLRVATTLGTSFSPFMTGFTTARQWNNQVVVLGSDLRKRGTVADLGPEEKVYSARFVGPQGYVVTFRQTDPLYILDLSNPDSPKKAGELKIPGVSTYLHPLTDKYLLGVGRESGRVKLSLFDVSNPNSPVEADKIYLDAYWSEAQDNPHAFLQDEKHAIFFLPGDQYGYVISYANGKLSQKVKAGQMFGARAVYLNDYLYMIGNQTIQVFNESDWSVAGVMNR